MARVRVGEEDLEVREESFQIIREEWNEYAVSDGVRLRIKLSLLRVFRVLDTEGQPTFTAEGDPQVVVKHSVEVVSSR